MKSPTEDHAHYSRKKKDHAQSLKGNRHDSRVLTNLIYDSTSIMCYDRWRRPRLSFAPHLFWSGMRCRCDYEGKR